MKVEIPMTEVVAEQVVATERALKRVAEVLRGEAPGSFLRVSVNGGGCSGFQYSFDIAPAADDGDIILGEFQNRGWRSTRSRSTFSRAPGSIIVDDLMGSSFRVENPNATASCGCGTSFAI